MDFCLNGLLGKEVNFRARYFAAMFMLAVAALPAFADAVDIFRNGRGMDASSSAFLVIDLETGEELASYNATKPLVPASIMKCVTVATLLDRMDVDDRFKTEVYRTGPISDGILEGNIVVVGSGDPSLNSRYMKDGGDICVEIAEALVRKGVRIIRGRIVVDENIWEGPAVPPSWVSGDLSQAYGTGSHGLNFEDNASGSRSVANPAGIFDRRLRSAFARYGITVEGEEIQEGTREEIVVHHSLPVDEIMRSCMMRSDNQYAEALLRTYAVHTHGRGSSSEGAKREKKFWSRFGAPMAGVEIVDGSGLSRSNRVTANFMASVLKERAGNPYYASFFPLAGQEGTLKNFLVGTPLDGYVAMKTGSMRGIQCYAGYKLDDDYAPTHIIVVMLNNMKNRGAARQAVSKALLSIFNPDAAEIAEEDTSVESSEDTE